MTRRTGSTIAAGYPRSFIDFAAARGGDRTLLLAEARLSAGDLSDPDARVALPRYMALIRAAIHQLNDPALPLEFGKAVRMQDISILGLICEAAETPYEVGRQLNRYAPLMLEQEGSPEIVRSTIDRDGIWMEAVGQAFAEHPWLVEAELARLVWNTRTMFAKDRLFQAMPFPKAVQFTQPEPAHRAVYEHVFGGPVAFSATRNGILLDPRFGQLRQPPTNRYVFGVLSEKADALMRQLELGKTTRARVETLVMPLLHTGDAEMDRIAGQIALSRRTLQRRLASEGTTFERVLDELRHRLALNYLEGRKVSVNETAYLLGFSDPAAFSRAFKRWTGMSPGGFRKSC